MTHHAIHCDPLCLFRLREYKWRITTALNVTQCQNELSKVYSRDNTIFGFGFFVGFAVFYTHYTLNVITSYSVPHAEKFNGVLVPPSQT